MAPFDMNYSTVAKNDCVENLLLNCLKTLVPDIQPAAILRLEVGDLGENLTLAVITATAIVFETIMKPL